MLKPFQLEQKYSRSIVSFVIIEKSKSLEMSVEDRKKTFVILH